MLKTFVTDGTYEHSGVIRLAFKKYCVHLAKMHNTTPLHNAHFNFAKL